MAEVRQGVFEDGRRAGVHARHADCLLQCHRLPGKREQRREGGRGVEQGEQAQRLLTPMREPVVRLPKSSKRGREGGREGGA
eukprot:651886-Hanusia_phi.AAC.2